MQFVILALAVILIIFFLPDILSAAFNVFIVIAILVGVLVALNMILRSNKEKYKMQLNSQANQQPLNANNSKAMNEQKVDTADMDSTKNEMKMF